MLGKRHAQRTPWMSCQSADVNLIIENLAGGVAEAPFGTMVKVRDMLHGPILDQPHARAWTELVLQGAGRLRAGVGNCHVDVAAGVAMEDALVPTAITDLLGEDNFFLAVLLDDDHFSGDDAVDAKLEHDFLKGRFG